ncbi:MAG: L-seryl-tRNA(Sec) selenium transferase, partial [Bacillota bacterium]
EPTVQETIKAGMDIVTISGDKLLGGPQAGIILGRREWIERMRKHPLNRALRIDKLTLAALESTLKLYLDEAKAVQEIPVLRMLTVPLKTLALRAEKIWIDLTMAVGDVAEIKVRDEFSQVGGGSMPLQQLPTKVLTVVPKLMTVDQLDERLREYMTPIFSRIAKDQLILDLRTIQEGELSTVTSALIHILTSQQEV